MPTVMMEIRAQTAVLTLNRPDKRNALNARLRVELREQLERIEASRHIRAVVVTGAGEAFAAGADIAAMQSYTPADAQAAAEEGCALFAFMEEMRVPIIAAVNGWALGGGCELALACDMRICAPEARFGQPELRLGLIPAYGALFRLPRLVGPAKAKEMVYTGRLLDARESLEAGLVSEIIPRDHLLQRAFELADAVSPAALAVSAAKTILNRAFDLTRAETDAFAASLYADLYRSEDLHEGLSAFLEKRKPQFKGR